MISHKIIPYENTSACKNKLNEIDNNVREIKKKGYERNAN